MSHSSLFAHIVFSTKERRPWLREDVRPRIFQYMGGIAANMKCDLIGAGGVADHVHLVVLVHPSVAAADFVRTLKSNSSGWVHEVLPDLAGFAWQDGYAAFSVSMSVLPRVKQYVATQEAHHKKMTFEQELVELFRRHNIAYDPRYLLG
ncbi:MAG: IS200/IS605 family transposase [Acidobacteria bacterium]|nr:IS200/IS605 family transposase [Acidobacteriota bacterium]